MTASYANRRRQLTRKLVRAANKHGVYSEEYRRATEALQAHGVEEAKQRAWEWACRGK